MNEFLMSFFDNITFLSLSICVLNVSVMFLILYIRIESVRSAFKKAGLNLEFFIKMIIASIVCFMMALVIMALDESPFCIPICVALILVSFLLISHIRVLEVRPENKQK